MRQRRNKLGRFEFVFEHLFWIFISWLWYKNILFRCLPGRSYRESVLILLGTIAAVCVWAVPAEMNRYRNHVSLAVNLLMGYGLYTAAAYLDIRGRLVLAVLGSAFGLVLVFGLMIMCRKIGRRADRRRILKRRALDACITGYRLLGAGMAVMLLLLGGRIVLGSSIMSASSGKNVKAAVPDTALEAHMETLVLLEEDNWEKLILKERLNVLQAVADIEKQYLGVHHEINVGAANLDDSTDGYYREGTHEVILSMEMLAYGSSWDVLDTLFHEIYHSYEFCLAEAYREAGEPYQKLKIFRDFKKYGDELENYQNGKQDYTAYYIQLCESDAREYAEETVYLYQLRISEYLKKTA